MEFANDTEMWRFVDVYDNYEVSSFGRVRNDRTGHILKQQLNKNGYQQVTLYKDGRAKNHTVHRLVALAFCHNPDEYDVADHISKNKTDNMYNNLHWVVDNQNEKKLN